METHYSHCRHTRDRWTSVHAESVPIRPQAEFLYQRLTLPHTSSAKSSNKTQKKHLQLITRESPESNNPQLKGKPDFITGCCSSSCVQQGLLQTHSATSGCSRILAVASSNQRAIFSIIKSYSSQQPIIHVTSSVYAAEFAQTSHYWSLR